MASPTAVDSFLRCLRASGLVDGVHLESLLLDLRREDVDIADAQQIADGMVRKKLLTAWQAEKLLRGKRRGFVLGKYRLLSLLGRGGAGSVYLAEHMLMRRPCALKVLPPIGTGDPYQLERFHQEARVLASLEHTNVVRAYDIDQGMDGSIEIHFFVMEYVEGETLADRVARTGPLTVVDAADAVRQAAAGLAHAHRAAVIHRDVKPANLLLEKTGIVKILDLGMASLLKDGPSTGSPSSGAFGTTDYISPEQALDGRTVDARSDIYSLGCTLYFLLAGHPPFPHGTFAQRLVSHQFEVPEPIAGKRPDVPAELASVLERMLAKRPADRFQTADEVEERMRDFLVRHADASWLKKNPGILRRAAAVKEAAPAATSAKPKRVAPPSAAAAQVIAPILEMERDGGLSPLTRSIMTRSPDRSQFRPVEFLRQSWNDRRGRELLIAAIMLFSLGAVIVWNFCR